MASFFATAIEIPTKSLYAASASSVARHLADDNRVELAELYRKVSINLLCAGLLLFGCIWVSIDSLYHLMPNSEVVLAGKWVFFFIGLSRLVEMGTGLNNYLIYYSKYYAWSLLSLGLMAVANIVFGYWLIPRLGIEGAALATLLSITAYNLFSLGLVWQKFGLQPFTRQTLVAVGLGGVTLTAVSCLPQWTQWPLFNLLLRSGLYGGILAFLLFWRGVSPDLNAIAERYLGRWQPLRQKR
jgi:O-antigen/teichoic acid export membrane protein